MVFVFAIALTMGILGGIDKLTIKHQHPTEIYTVIDCVNEEIWSDSSNIHIGSINIKISNISSLETFNNTTLFIIEPTNKFTAIKIENSDKLVWWINDVVCRYRNKIK
jgi:hypothetical protein